MKRFSSNITDEELYRLFRNAAYNYDPKLNGSEKICVWESIANGLLADLYNNNARPVNKWKRRCIALLLVWLLTGGLAIFRIIQLQDLTTEKSPVNDFEILKTEDFDTEMPIIETPLSQFPNSKFAHYQQYRLSARWPFATGGIVSAKQYRLQDAYFQTSPTMRSSLKSSEADSRVIDISPYFRFDVMHKKEGRLYTGTGLSSKDLPPVRYLW